MIDILGKKYVSEKEASALCGYSIHWLRKERQNRRVPEYIRLTKFGKIYYERIAFEIWITKRIAESE